MTLVKWHRNEDMPVFSNFFDNYLNRDMDELFSNSYTRRMPAVNVLENKEEFRIEVAAPGMIKEDFKINLENNIITIESKKEMKNEQKDERYTRREFCFNSFQRTFTLPNTADTNNIEATYKDGILYVVIPKREEARQKPAREISIA